MNETIKVKGYNLDTEQIDAIKCPNKSVLVIAGAGCGKTTTIIGKVKYLLNQGINKKKIVCISFTNEATKKLKEDLFNECQKDINVLTFHKLALSLISNQYSICSSDYLEYVINEYFESIIITKKNILKALMNYLYLPNNEMIYNSIIKQSSEIITLKKIIKKFIMMMKANNNNIYSFNKYLIDNSKLNFFERRKNFILLRIILDIYQEYNNELKSSKKIDFDDMISLAIEYVKENNIPNYKYIIIDEFQDSSRLRCELIKSIIKKNDSYLFAVGDDFQSIYRFSGCDLEIFLKFEEIFENATIKIISKTYRNSRELIAITGSFIMKNKCLTKKNLVSDISINNPIIIYYYQNIKEIKQLIIFIKKQNNKSLYIIGRNNFDINKYSDYIVSEQVKYYTAHKSKGLESDNVIIINLDNNDNGIPNKKSEHKIMNLISYSQDRYPYSEERRLFYVALTRTKNRVYLFVNKKNKSIFVKELIKDNKIKIINKKHLK